MKHNTYDFTPNRNGGQTLLLSTNKDDDGNVIHEIILCSFENTATLRLSEEMITPAKLRECADAMEAVLND